MTSQALPYQADGRTLAAACGAAAVVGVAVLALFVLPAEYGVDPTGVGKALGLKALSQGVDEDDTATAPGPAKPTPSAIKVPEQNQDSIVRATPYRSDEQVLTIAPHAGVELKAEMKAGDQFVFSWTATGPVKMDMHGEASLTAQDFSTYWKQKGLTQAQGTFMAPFAGIHGWYWRNQGATPVTVTLKTSGFYAKLVRPPVE